MANVIFKVGTRTAYDALATKDASTLYWSTDEQALYKGDVLYGTGREATSTLAGLLSAEDKAKLDSLTVTDGTVLASEVMFETDLVFTEAFGRYTPTDGKVTVPAAGKSWQEVLTDAFSQDKNPTITQPSVTLTAANVKAYEVGTSVAPAYSAVLNAGSYEYGPETGITASAWSVTNTDGGSLTTASGTFDAITVGDDTSYSITATATYEAGAVPLTALGAEYTDGQIAAGSKSATKGTITGYRNSFYGTLTAKDGEINSTLVRGLTSKSGKALVAGNSFTITIPVGAIRVVFAYPATLQDVSSVTDVNGMNAEIKTAFTQYTVSVEGANSYTAIDYKVYVMDMAAANDTANTYKVTI